MKRYLSAFSFTTIFCGCFKGKLICCNGTPGFLELELVALTPNPICDVKFELGVITTIILP